VGSTGVNKQQGSAAGGPTSRGGGWLRSGQPHVVGKTRPEPKLRQEIEPLHAGLLVGPQHSLQPRARVDAQLAIEAAQATTSARTVVETAPSFDARGRIAALRKRCTALSSENSVDHRDRITNNSRAMSWEYSGILAAMQLPFAQDLSIDEPELRRFTNWLAGHKGIGGLGWGARIAHVPPPKRQR
jgi:hypothetical protein